MLLYSTVKSNKTTIAGQAKTVIDGGCRWIQLSVDGMSAEEAKTEAETIIPLCKDSDTILVIDHYIDVVNDLRVHGVHLFPGDISPAEAREKLGPHAIIGVKVETAADIIALKGKDIDYVTLGPYPHSITVERYQQIINEVRTSGEKIPVVAYGSIDISDIDVLLSAGVNGIMVSHEIADATSAEDKTRQYLEALAR